MAALAHYNLGLVALARGDSAQARHWFARCTDETQDERLLALASTQLAKLGVEPQSGLDWTAYAALAAGYDDNVALVSNSDVLGVSGGGDAFVDGQFVAAFPIGEAWRLDAGAMLLAYRELNRFDQFTAYGGGRYRRAIGNWITDAGVQLAHGLLGGDAFQNVHSVQLQGNTQVMRDWPLRLRYRVSNIDGMGDFTGIGGTRQEASVRLRRETNLWKVGAEVRLENSDLQDASLSTTRHQFVLSIERPLGAAWTFACELARSHGNFDLAANGNEDRTDLEMSISRLLGTNWQIALSYVYADNDADRGEFDYERNRIALGVERML